MTTSVSFYSYKGGTGRSTALCNVAYALAERGATVGCVDFDMEAAGLHHIFDVGAKMYGDVGKIQGLLQKEFHEPLELNEHVLNLVDYRFFDRDLDGEIYLIPAGIDAEQTLDVVVDGNYYEGNANIFTKFKQEYDLDYLFIDTRSGLSEAAVPSAKIVDLMCVFFRFTSQHKQGTRDAMRFMEILEASQGRAMPELHGVASNIPEEIDKEQIQEYIDKFEFIDEFDTIREEERLKRDEEVLLEKPKRRDLEIVDHYQQVADSITEYR